MDHIVTKLKKAYLKLLKHSCNNNWEKARKQHARIIGLELELRIRESKQR